MGGKEELIQELGYLGYLFVNLQSGSTVEEVCCQEACLEGKGLKDRDLSRKSV